MKDRLNTAEVVDIWPEPVPPPSGLPPVEKFELGMLPEPLARWTADIAERMQAPLEFVAVPAVVAAGAVIGRKVGIRPQSNTDWYEVPNLWGCIIGRPGVMKSPAVQAALGPLKALQAEARRDFEQQHIRYEAGEIERDLRADARKKKLKERFKLNPRADTSDLAYEEEQEPTLKRYIANDTSYQSLGELLIENPNGILVHRDEIMSLLRSLDRDENVEARGFYLTGWNGTDDYTFDRIARGKNLYVPSLTISMIGSTQPGRVREYAASAIRGGAGDDGLIQRFGLMVWPDVTSEWTEHDRQPDSAARATALKMYERLNAITPPSVGAQIDPFDERRPYLRFDEDALAEFRTWRKAHEKRVRSADLHRALESHLAKYRTLVPALALIHHLVSDRIGPVEHPSVLAALAWAEYLESHANRIYAAAISSSADSAREIIRHLKRGDLAAPFTAREVLRRGWSGLATKEQVADALELLEELHWIRPTPVLTTINGGRPTVSYMTNPKGFML